MKNKLLFSFIIALICGFVLGANSPVFSAVYYVDNVAGKDSNTGSVQTPYKTIAKAMDKIGLGDTVVIIGNGDDKPYLEPVIIKTSGREGALVTIRGESEDKKPVIKGDSTGSILRCYGKHHILIKNIVFKGTNFQALGFAKTCSNITLEDLEIYDVGKNGILINDGGHDFTITNCVIRRIGNTGIALMGDGDSKLSNTIIQGCTVSDAYTNDGISLHKDDEGNDIGSHHVIKNNEISNCAEQGIDITAGADIVVDHNTTQENHDSGILIDHGASNVTISNHKSVNEVKCGIIVGHSKDVRITKSSFKGAFEKTALVIVGCENLLVEESSFVAEAGSNSRQIVDLELRSPYVTKNITFHKNRFLAAEGNNSGSVMLRFLHGGPSDVSVTWDGNVWYNYQNDKRVYYDANAGKYDFTVFKQKYAPSDVFALPTSGLGTPLNLRLK